VRLRNKVALITGGGAGIGRAGLEAFLREGAKVMVAELKPDFIARLERELPGRGEVWEAVETNVTELESVQNAVQATVSRFGRLDVLYNNAGAAPLADGNTLTAEVDAFWDAIRLNLFGTWLMSRCAIPEIARSGGGSIINTASSAGLVPVSRVECYGAAKAGVVHITKTMAMAFADQNIRVNAVAPGRTNTERTRAAEVLRSQKAGDVQPTRKELFGLGEPSDVANVVVFLASDEAAKVTGLTIPVDSGFSL
jgi:NAD(P)-dependent dehydrogenase (short-subunit alcohol dehydrogenase family)